MKIDKLKLKQLIQEETQKLLQEDWRDIFSPSDQPKSETLPWTTALGRLVNKYADLFPEATGQEGRGVYVPAGAAAAGNIYGPAYHRPTGFRDPAMEETEGPIATYVDIEPGQEPAGVKRRIPAPFLRAGDPMTWPFPGEVAATPSSIRHQYEDQPGWTAAGATAEAAALAAGIRIPSMPRLKPIIGVQHGRGLTQRGLFRPGLPDPHRPIQLQKGTELNPITGKFRTVGSGGTRIKHPESFRTFFEQYELATDAAINQPLSVNDLRRLMRIYHASNFNKADLLRAIKSNIRAGTFKKGVMDPKNLLAFFERPGMLEGEVESLRNLQSALWDMRAPRTMSPFPDLRTGKIVGWTGSNRAAEIAREAKRLGLEPFEFYPFGEEASIYDFATGKLVSPGGEGPLLVGYTKPLPKKPATVQKFPSGEPGDYRAFIDHLKTSSSAMHDAEYLQMLKELGLDPSDLVFESISKSKFKKITSEEYNKLLKEHAAQYIWGVKAPYNRVANKYNLHRMSSEKLRKLKL